MDVTPAGVRTYTAFAGHEQIAAGELVTVVTDIKARTDAGDPGLILVFEDETGAQVDFDLRGTVEEALARLGSHPRSGRGDPSPSLEGPRRSGPGRPRLGVVSREVSLLPRHWAWLEQEKGGASAALRRLVDDARKRGEGAGRARRAWDAAGAVMWAIAGNLPGFEEATRALYARNTGRVAALIRDWPDDVRAYVGRLACEAERLQHAADRDADRDADREPGAGDRAAE